MPPPSPEESGAGPPEVESTGSDGGGEIAVGPQPKKARRGSRAPRPSDKRRRANRRVSRRRGEPPRCGGKETVRRGLSGDAVAEWECEREECVSSRVHAGCLLAPSRGGVLLLGETRSAELTLGDPCYGPATAHPPGLGLSSP